MVPIGKGVEDVNIGTANNPKMVKLSKSLSLETKGKYMSLMREFIDAFAWDYLDLKFYDKSIIQHTIPIKLDQNPFRQKLKRINPKLLPSIEKEVNRLYNSGIIVPIWFSEWMSNLEPVRNKTGEIHLCIDFRNLNKVSLKDNYPLPKMDHILQRVVGSSRISLLDGYSGYNQILKCIKCGISLNPKKSLFAMEEGKLLGHIISKDGIHIDPTRMEAIQQLEFLRNKKEIQYFNGKIIFLRIFIPNLAEHLKEMTNMLKKESEIK
eukprot:PITA_14994